MKKLFIITILLLLTACQNTKLGGLTPIQQEILDKPYLQLKASKDKIVFNVETDYAEEIDGKMEINGKMVLYNYISDKEVKDEVIFEGGDYANTVKLSEKGKEKQWRVWGRYKFYKDATKKVFEVEIGTTTPEAYAEQTKLTLLDKVKSFFGKPAYATYPPTGGGEGEIYVTNSSSWAARRSSSGSGDEEDGVYPTATYMELGTLSTNLYRNFMPYPTSALPDTDVVTAASLHQYVRALGGANGSPTFALIQTTEADPTALATTDFGNLTLNSPPEGSTRLTPNSTAEYKTFTFNATGLGWISTTGYTKLGFRDGGHDVDNVDPSGETNYIVSESVESAGKEPYMDITSETPASEPPSQESDLIFFE